MFRTLVRILACAAVMGPAVAADLPAGKAPPPVIYSAYNWTGFFGGVHIGYVTGEATANFALPASFSQGGIFGGVQAGYNYQFANNAVLGLWATVPIASTAKTFPAFGVRSEQKWAVAGGVRLGYAFDRFLPFIHTGIVFGENRIGFVPGGPFESNTHVGWTVGAGVEYAVADRWSTTLRYAYTSFTKEGYPVLFGPGAKLGQDSHSVAIGLNYHFGR